MRDVYIFGFTRNYYVYKLFKFRYFLVLSFPAVDRPGFGMGEEHFLVLDTDDVGSCFGG